VLHHLYLSVIFLFSPPWTAGVLGAGLRNVFIINSFSSSLSWRSAFRTTVEAKSWRAFWSILLLICDKVY